MTFFVTLFECYKSNKYIRYIATMVMSHKDIEDIQVFGVNMNFISLSEVKIFYIS